MVPLGILTMITGAIRVQGSRIARSFIGRARENRALAELELMSSTSREVCELFNGKSIVRVMGKPSITQVLVFPYEYNAEAKKLSDGRATDASWGIHSLETATSTGPEVLMQCVRRYHSEPLTTAAGHAYILHRPSKSQQGHHFRASPMCGAAPRSAGARD
jgi:hypothetical protein